MGHETTANWKRLGDGSLPTEDADEGLGHIAPKGLYEKILGALMVLTVLTVLAAMADFGILNLAIAMGIATIKATLVMLFFMHLRWENKLVVFVATYPLFVFILLMFGTWGDAAVRPHPESSTIKLEAPKHSLIDKQHH